MLRYITAGESHGKALNVIIEGIPAGLELTTEIIEAELFKRKQGYGRGPRQKIETDSIEILSGIRFNKTIGSPVAILLRNKDFENWVSIMAPAAIIPNDYQEITKPRPGHADYAGITKYGTGDIRDVLERSSARETAMRVVVGAVAKAILKSVEISSTSYVFNIGGVEVTSLIDDVDQIEQAKQNTHCTTINTEIDQRMINKIDEAKETGVSLGGKIAVVLNNVPVGLGSYVHWDRKLDANVARAVISVQAIKSVGFGMGCAVANNTGDKVHDEYQYQGDQLIRLTNNAGGFEGGVTNGQPILVKAAMKPIPTMKTVLKTVDLKTKENTDSFYERADVCAVEAAAVVCESVVAIEIANALFDKFGGDSISELAERAYLWRCTPTS